MKLPGINYRTAGPDVSALPLQKARAWSGALNSIGDVVQDYVVKKESESSRQELMKSRMDAADAQLLIQKPKLSPNEIPANVNFNRTEKKLVNGVMTEVPREWIPTHEVQEQILANTLGDIDSRAKETLSPRAYRKFQNSWIDYSTSMKIRNGQLKLKRAQKEEADLLDAQVEGLVQRGLWDDARVLVNNSEFLNEGQALALSQDLDFKEEFSDAQEAIMSGDVPRIQAVYDGLSDDKTYAGNLDTNSRYRLRRAARVELNKLTAKEKVDTRMMTFQAKQNYEAMMDGMAPPDDLGRQIAELEANGKYAEADKLKIARSQNMVLSELSQFPIHTQDEYLKVMRENADSPEEFKILDGAEKALQRQRKAFKKDTVQFALDSENYEMAPINWGSQTLVEDLNQRWHDISKIEVQSGETSGFLSGTEVAQFNAVMQEANPAEEQKMRQTINEGFGRQAHIVWSQLKVKDSGGKYSKAGDISAYNIAGSAEMADSVSNGLAMIKESPDFFKPIEKEMKNSDPYRRASTLYMPGPESNSLMNAIKGRYAYLASTSGVTEFSSDIYEEATEDVTGGTVDVLGRVTEAPIPGMSQDQVDDWLGNITPQYLESIGNPTWDSRDLAEFIQDGDMLVIPVGRNMYGLAHKDNPREVIYDSSTGEPYRFRYDPALVAVEEEDEDAGFVFEKLKGLR